MSYTGFACLPRALRRPIFDFEVEIEDVAGARMFDAAIVVVREPVAAMSYTVFACRLPHRLRRNALNLEVEIEDAVAALGWVVRQAPQDCEARPR